MDIKPIYCYLKTVNNVCEVNYSQGSLDSQEYHLIDAPLFCPCQNR